MKRIAGACLAVLLVGPAIAHAADPAALDPSFGAGGQVQTDAQAIAPVPGGGTVEAAAGFRVTRRLADGRPDPAFARGTTLPGLQPLAVTAGADGRVIVSGGDPSTSSGRQVVERLQPDGRPDPSFGSGGVADLPAPATSVAEAADGAVLAATPAGVLRLRPDGALDTTFGDGGLAAAGRTLDETATGVALDAAGRPLVQLLGSTGDPHDGSTSREVRLRADGQPDPAFAPVDGVVDVTRDGLLAPLSAATCRYPEQAYDGCGLAFARVDDGGVLAPQVAVAGSSHDAATAVDADAAGDVVVAGDDGAVARVAPDGRTDAGFGACGVATAPLPGVVFVQLQASGRIVLAGFRAVGNGQQATLEALRGGPGRTPALRVPRKAPGFPDVGETQVGRLTRLRVPYRQPVTAILTARLQTAGRRPTVLARSRTHVRPCRTAETALSVPAAPRARLLRQARRTDVALTLVTRVANAHGAATARSTLTVDAAGHVYGGVASSATRR